MYIGNSQPAHASGFPASCALDHSASGPMRDVLSTPSNQCSEGFEEYRIKAACGVYSVMEGRMRNCAIVLAAIAAGLVAAPAQAETRFAKVCIKNETTSNMVFSWRFGTADWRKVTLSAGREQIFTHKLAKVNQNTSPPLYVTYDAKKVGTDIEPKVLAVGYASGDTNCNQAKHHAFRTDPQDKNFITLYSVD